MSEIIHFTLNTNDASSTNQYNTIITWNNIDIRNIISERLCQKYDAFNITCKCLLSNVMPIDNSSQFASHGKYNCAVMSGLPWMCSNYSTKTKTRTQQAVIMCTDHRNETNLAPTAQLNSEFMACTFSTPVKTNVEITITFNQINGAGSVSVAGGGTNVFPTMLFMFTITPCVTSIDWCSILYLPNTAYTIDTFGTTLTCSNLSMRELLGDLYDLYDYFTIDLVSAIGSIRGVTINDNSRAATLLMSGLEFVSCLQNETLATFNYSNVNSGSDPFIYNDGVMDRVVFRKRPGRFDLKLIYWSIQTQQIMQIDSGSISPAYFIFRISPIR